jgi:hypothetical protein
MGLVMELELMGVAQGLMIVKLANIAMLARVQTIKASEIRA